MIADDAVTSPEATPKGSWGRLAAMAAGLAAGQRLQPQQITCAASAAEVDVRKYLRVVARAMREE
jgi:hypothetical protein